MTPLLISIAVVAVVAVVCYALYAYPWPLAHLVVEDRVAGRWVDVLRTRRFVEAEAEESWRKGRHRTVRIRTVRWGRR
jgi:hypothetical protein